MVDRSSRLSPRLGARGARLAGRAPSLRLLALLLGALFAAASASRAGAAAAPVKRPPDILFILIDDLGWRDVAFQGNERIETPNLDRLSREGMRFTDAYAPAPVCSPTRASILTGKSPARLRITNHIPDRESFRPKSARLASAPTLDHLPAEEVTIAERLRGAGYATGFLGKWHLAGRSRREGLGDLAFYPERQGFASNLGGCALGGPPAYFDPYRIHNLPPEKKGEYLPDRLAREAIEFIRAPRDRPWLLFLWDYAVHWPMESPPALVKKYEGRRGPGLIDPRYGAMIEALDAALGRIFRAIDELGRRDRTLVVFTSDNGGFTGVADNRPLRAGKGYLYEGGIRVPLVVRWPGVVAPGSVCRVPVVLDDFYPTLLEAAGLRPRPGAVLDGVSLMPLLSGRGALERESIFFHYPNYAWHGDNRLGSAVRKGRWKLIENFDDGSVELYDLESDLGERRNLKRERPELAVRLRGELHRWREESNAAMPRPLPRDGGEPPPR